MQTKEQTVAGIDDGGFKPIPTRIRNLPPLIVEPDADTSPEFARDMLARLGELSRSLATTHRAAAEAYLSQEHHEEALRHVEAAATFAPDNVEYRNQLGFLCYLTGDDDRAITSFNAVITAQPDNADALFNLGMVLFGKQDTAAAEECFRRSLDLRPDDAEGWNNRGVCLHQLGRTAEARACFERALQVEPNNEDARANLADLGAAV